MLLQHVRVGLSALAGLFAFVCVADAQAAFWVRASGNVGFNVVNYDGPGSPPSQDTGELSQPSTHIEAYTYGSNDTGAFATAEYNVQTTPGSMRLYGTARADGSNNATFSATSSFFDTITLTSPTLTPGTPVSMLISGHWEFTAERSTPYYPWGVTGSVNIRQMNDGGLYYRAYDYQSHYGSPPDNDFEYVLNGLVGESYKITMGMSIGGTTAGGNPAENYVIVDATSTGLLTISSLTPGAGFESESGALYVLPEPSALGLLLGVGCCALTRCRVRQ